MTFLSASSNARITYNLFVLPALFLLGYWSHVIVPIEFFIGFCTLYIKELYQLLIMLSFITEGLTFCLLSTYERRSLLP